jgi:hypothetical protein
MIVIASAVGAALLSSEDMFGIDTAAFFNSSRNSSSNVKDEQTNSIPCASLANGCLGRFEQIV